MSLYEIRERSERVSKWLKEDEELISRLYTILDQETSKDTSSQSSSEHDMSMRKMREVAAKYATLSERAARADEKVKLLKNMCRDMRVAVDRGYIE